MCNNKEKNKQVLYGNKKECCGCSACYSICTHNAIEMVCDTKGFLYPTIDELRCVSCGLCKLVCPFLPNED